MGWRELRGWLGALNRLNRAADPDPDHWTDASRANFDELADRRRKMRGQ